MTESFITLSGQRGLDPDSGELVDDAVARVRQIFKNMFATAEASGADQSNTARLVVYVADMNRDRPIINQVQEEIWQGGPYPPRTIVEVDYLGDDFVEIDGVFRVPEPDSTPLKFLAPADAFTPTATWSLGVKADTHVFVSGMRGINPSTDQLVIGEAPRVRQAFENMQMIANAGGANLTDAIGLVLYVTNEDHLELFEAMAKKYWDGKPLPPLEVNIVTSLNDNDFIEIEGTFTIVG